MDLVESEGRYRVEGDQYWGASSGIRWSVTDEEGKILADMARGKVVLEIGTGLGVSTRAMASTAIHVLTVDIDEWVHENVFPGLRSMGNVTAVDDIPVAPGVFGLVFIDGLHTVEAVERDTRTALEMVSPHGSIVYHDYRLHEVRAGIEAAGISSIEILDTLTKLAVYQAC